MSADVVIRGGTVYDGSGAPGRPADVAIKGSVIREIGPEPAGRTRARRVGLRRRAGLHRHPHPLRRPGFLGPGPAAVVLSRRHHRGGGQLRLRDRAHPPRASRRDRAHARERRGHEPRDADRGHRVGVRDVPAVHGPGPPARHGAQLHGLHRSLRRAALCDGRCGLRARRHGRGDRAHVRARSRGDRTRARRDSRPASHSRTAASTASPSRAASPSATRSRRSSSRPDRRARASCSQRRASSAAIPTSTS